MNKIEILSAGSAALFGALAVCNCAVAQDSTSSKNAETTVVTNDNGLVTKMYTESGTVTNGNMVTTKKFITVTTLDPEGNIVGSRTTESSKSVSGDASAWAVVDESPSGFTVMTLSDPVDDEWEIVRSTMRLHRDMDNGWRVLSCGQDGRLAVCGNGTFAVNTKPDAAAEKAKPDFSFLGIKLGAKLDDCESLSASDIKWGGRYRTSGCKGYSVVPPKKLDGFTCEVWVTPKTRKIVSVVAKASDARPDAVKSYDYVEKALRRKYGEPEKGLGIRSLGSYWNLGNQRSIRFRCRGRGLKPGDADQAVISVADLDLERLATKERVELNKEKAKIAEDEAKKRLEEAVEAF